MSNDPAPQPSETPPAPASGAARSGGAPRFDPTQSLPYLTADLPGVGGTLRASPEDFEVEELPEYLPSGEGEFIYLWVEKRGLSAEQLTSHLARELGIALQDVGMAGMKDRHAVTRQQVSVPRKAAERVAAFQHPQIRILRTGIHRNKLRPGHLQGNQFGIVVRNVGSDALARAEAIRARIEQFGVPNYYGEQRFGRDAQTLSLGFELLRGETEPYRIPRARRKFLLRLALSAVQSALFNQAVMERMAEGLLHRVLVGDVMQVTATGGIFTVEDADREQPRFDAGEIMLTGPIFGPRMIPTRGDVTAREERLLAAHGLVPDHFLKYKNLTPGTRRHYLIRPRELAVSGEPGALRFGFTLPAGAYATVLLREFMKVESESP
jgi:tRNA pseudouridine13 synthase